MALTEMLDITAIGRACQQFGVERLWVFGSILSDRFDPEDSDVECLVEFFPDNETLFADYFDLKAELERIVGREVDLVDISAVRNPYFKKSARANAQELYAA